MLPIEALFSYIPYGLLFSGLYTYNVSADEITADRADGVPRVQKPLTWPRCRLPVPLGGRTLEALDVSGPVCAFEIILGHGVTGAVQDALTAAAG